MLEIPPRTNGAKKRIQPGCHKLQRNPMRRYAIVDYSCSLVFFADHDFAVGDFDVRSVFVAMHFFAVYGCFRAVNVYVSDNFVHEFCNAAFDDDFRAVLVFDVNTFFVDMHLVPVAFKVYG